jgi:uncharacterized integral membrane protein
MIFRWERLPRAAGEQTGTMAYASENGRPAPHPSASEPPTPLAPGSIGSGSNAPGAEADALEPAAPAREPSAGGVLEPRPAERPGPAEPHPGRPDSQLHQRVPRTRVSAVWLGVVAGVLALILLIIFVAQNTARVRIHFLWMTGDFPISVAFLLAVVGGALIAIAVSAARIIQLRRLVRRRR